MPADGAKFPIRPKTDAPVVATNAQIATDPKCANMCLGTCCLWIVVIVLGFVWAWIPAWSVNGNQITGMEVVDVRRLTRGMDYAGNLCGVSPDTADKGFLYYCGSKAQRSDGSGLPEQLDWNAKVCLSSCPTTSTELVDCLRPVYPQFSELAANRTVMQLSDDGLTQLGEAVYKSSYVLNVLQTVERTKTYPTETYLSYCMPKDTWLRESVLSGPIAKANIITRLGASIWHAWPIMLICFAFSIIMCAALMLCLGKIGGMVIASSFIATAVLLFLLAVFFIIGIFMPMSDGETESTEFGYTHLNPIMHSIWGWSGKFTSVLVGVLCVFLGCIFLQAFQNEKANIDKQIGIIYAGYKCTAAVSMATLVQTFILIIGASVLFAGAAALASFGYVDHTNLIVNSSELQGLQGTFEWFFGWWWNIVMLAYVVFALYCFDVLVGVCQFSTTFMACEWYFSPNGKVSGEVKTIDMSAGLTHTNARLSGVDAGGSDRQAAIFHGAQQTGQKYAILPLAGKSGPGKKAPGPAPISVQVRGADSVEKLTFQATAVMFKSFSKAGWQHLGSICYSKCYWKRLNVLNSFIVLWKSGMPTDYYKPPKDADWEEDAGRSARSAFFLFSKIAFHWVDGMIQGKSERCYPALVLRDEGCELAAKEVFSKMEDSGGNVTFLYGCAELYAVAMVWFVSIVTMIVGTILLKIDEFPLVTDTVQDTWLVTLTIGLCASLVAQCFVGAFNIVIDTMLYCVCYCREFLPQIPQDDEDKAANGVVKPTDDQTKRHQYFCPASLADLLVGELAATPATNLVKDLKIPTRMEAPGGSKAITKMQTMAGHMMKHGGSAMATMKGSMMGGKTANTQGVDDQDPLLGHA